jgi:hypothetical protein
MKTEEALALIKSIRMRELNGWEKDFIYSMKGRIEDGKAPTVAESKKIQEVYRSSWQSQKETHQKIG